MAKPFEDTPPITGKDAKRFAERIKHPEKYRPTDEELRRMKENYEIMCSIYKADDTDDAVCS